MGKYTAIADVGQALVRLLQESLCPEPLQNPESIALYSPAERGDTVLGLYLYDVQESEEIRAVRARPLGNDQMQAPPLYLSLYYMLSVFSGADLKFRSPDEHRILGRAMQALADNPVMDARTVLQDPGNLEPQMSIQLQKLSMEEKMRIWAFPNTPYRLSICYRVAPVEVESTRIRRVQRVVDVQIGAKE